MDGKDAKSKDSGGAAEATGNKADTSGAPDQTKGSTGGGVVRPVVLSANHQEDDLLRASLLAL